MRPFFSIIFLLIFYLQSCNNRSNQDPDKIIADASKDENFNKGSLNYHFDLPDDWYRIDTTLQGIFITVLMKNDVNYRPRINVTNESMKNKTHRDYALSTRNYLKNNMEGIELLEDGEFNVSGKNCYWNTYNMTKDGMTREMIFYSIAIGDISYNITAAFNVGGLARYRKTVDEIVKSFKLN
jgi:hypothetical protein